MNRTYILSSVAICVFLGVGRVFGYTLSSQDFDETYLLEDALYARMLSPTLEYEPTYYVTRIGVAGEMIRQQSERIGTILTRIAQDLAYLLAVDEAHSDKQPLPFHVRSAALDDRQPVQNALVFGFGGDEEEFPEGPLATYTISGDGALVLNEGVPHPNDQFAWELLSETVYDATSDLLYGIILYHNPDSDTSAYVEPIDDLGKSWIMAINTDGYITDDAIDSQELLKTLIHEYAHVLSLSYGELDASVGEQECETIMVQEGCAREYAMLYAYVQEFRDRTLFEDTESGRVDGETLYTFDTFVTQYAATNAAEDFAETMMYYMTGDQLLYGDELVIEKLRFFDAYPELQSARQASRAMMLRVIDETIWWG